MSQILFKISGVFLVLALAVLASFLYLSERHSQTQQQLAAAGDIEGAAREADSAARLDPFTTEPLEARASLFQSQGRNPEAESVYQQAIQREPNDYSLYVSLGNLQMTMDKFEAAEGNFREALRLNPMASSASASIAQSLVRRGSLEDARVEYEKLLENRQIDTLGRYDLGRILVRTGEPERGFRLINQARVMSERELEGLDGAVRERQQELIESMKLAAADARVVEGNYEAAYRLVSESDSPQAPALLQLISTNPDGYRESVVDSEIY